MLIGMIVVTAISLWVANKRVSISWNAISGPLIVGASACTIIATIFCLLIPASLIPLHTTAMIVVLLFPCASLLLAPAAIDWNRHR